MNRYFILLIIIVLALITTSSFPHAYLSSDSDVPARGFDMKDPPCGLNTRSATPKSLTAGSTITIRWTETVDHTGTYFIEFSPCGDLNWVRLKTITDTQNNPATVPHLFSTTVTVPNVNCEACTMRVVQEMIDDHADAPTYYFSCGDIRITGAN